MVCASPICSSRTSTRSILLYYMTRKHRIDPSISHNMPGLIDIWNQFPPHPPSPPLPLFPKPQLQGVVFLADAPEQADENACVDRQEWDGDSLSQGCVEYT